MCELNTHHLVGVFFIYFRIYIKKMMNYSLDEKAKIVLIARRVARSSNTSEMIDFFEQKLLGPPNPELKQCPICKISETVRVNVPIYRCINCHHEWEVTFPDISDMY